MNKGIGMSNRFSKAALLAGTVMAGAMMTTPVYAQEDADTSASTGDDDFIVVTGTRIQRRVNVDTAAPIAVVDAEEFELSGTVNVENVVNQLPQVVPGFTSNSNNPGTGTATLNLRGLGSARTMVLVNGRRYMFYDTAQIVDLNTIPSFLLDSVDVVTGGASAVYGSDALSGVVNFKLKDVEGVELGGQYSVTERGDGERYELFGAIGTQFDDGRGSATVFAEYYNRSSIFQGDRGFSNFALGDGATSLVPGGSSTLPNGVIRYFGGANGTGPQRIRDANDPTNNDDGIGDFAANNAVVFDSTPGDFRTRAGDLYNYAPANYLQIPQERYLIGGYADYEFTDGHEFYTEVSFVNNRVAQELAATPVTGTFSVDLATIQPFLVASDFAQLQAIDAEETNRNTANGDPDDPGVVDLFLQRRTVETGSRNTLDERNAFRVLGGVRGSITDWLNYDAYYMYARTRNANIQQGNISRSAFQAGLDGTAPAINIFGPNTLTPAMVQQISILAQNSDVSTLEVATGYLSGQLGNLGFGADDIGFAAGVEYRKVASQFIPDTALSSGDVIGFNAGNPTAGSYDVKEFFAELNIPILGPDSGVERLELTGAARYSDYSLAAVGGVWTYSGGIEFAPIPDITLRGQYQRAVRAPNVGELFGGQSIGFPGATDPCSEAAAATPGALRDLCIANGVPAGVVGTPGIQLNTQIPALFGGNPGLQEETSDSWTVGAVLEPSFIPGLTVTADYFDITIENAISTISLEQTFDLCFNQVQDANATVCAPFFANGPIRNAGGAITTANPPVLGGQNVATLSVSGVDLQVNYATTIPFSLLTDTGEQDFNLSFLGTWTDSSAFEAFPGADILECAGDFGLNCGEPTPKWKWTTRANFVDGPLTTSIRWRHVSGVDDDDDLTDFIVERVPAADYLDLTFSFEASEHLTVSLGVNNLFDKEPLLIGDNQEQANTYPSTYDVIGRDFFASARVRF